MALSRVGHSDGGAGDRKGRGDDRDAAAARADADADARDDRDVANFAVERFLAVVAHELRSPLNGIQSWTHVLEARLPEAAPSLQRAIAGIRTGVEQQVRLLDALSDAAHLLGDTAHLERRAFVLRPLVEAACSAARPLAAERDLQLVVDLRIGVESVRGDDGRVRQMLDLLLTEALRRSDPGGVVRVSAWVFRPVTDPRSVASPSSVHSLCIVVRDAGGGLRGSAPASVFEPFRARPTGHGSEGTTTSEVLRASGIGLELAVVRRLARLHGGDATCHDADVGQGTEFVITLPLYAGVPQPGA